MEQSDRERRFRGLWSEHYDAVHAYVRRRAPEAADDVTAEVFAVAWRRLDVIDDATARGWLYGVAHRRLLGEARSKRRRGALLDRLRTTSGGARSGEDLSPVGEVDAQVAIALRSLTPRDREIVLLATWEGLTTRELARALGCSPTAAKVRLHRARTRFRRLLELEAAPSDDPHPTPIGRPDPFSAKEAT